MKPLVIAARDRIALRYTANVETHSGWWFKYRVYRLHGIGIPENCYSYHRTLEGARKAAERWCHKNDKKDTEVVEQHGRVPSPPPPPPPDYELRG